MQTFEDYAAKMREQGYTEVVARSWKSDEVVDIHRHAFAAKALVVSGEMWLTRAGATRHLGIGDTFELEPHEPHSERYGRAGATYWVGRRNP